MTSTRSRDFWPIADAATPDLMITRFEPEETFKTKVYLTLKQAITNMDIHRSRAPTWLDERELSERLGVSRTPVREAIAMLDQEGFVKAMPRRGIMVVKKTLRENVEMIQAWAALESMACRLITQKASDEEIATLRHPFQRFDITHKPTDHLSEYSAANLAFHQSIIRMSGSRSLVEMTQNILLHVRGIRQITISRDDRASRSIRDHHAIIDALERRDADAAEQLSRDHTLGLAAFVEEHGAEFFD